MQEHYDYIVCGAGTVGCAVAGLLAKRGAGSILLIEAGTSQDDVPASKIPPGAAEIIGTSADWNIQSEPSERLNGRNLHLGRGKFVGGSSGTNGTLCIRGTRQDYDDWGLDGWSGDEVFDYMSRAENFFDNSWFKADPNAHGRAGPIRTEVHDPAPISQRVLQSYESKGLPLIPDLFSTGESSKGCGHATRTIHRGVRSSGADYLTGQDNLTIRTTTYVDRVILDEGPSGSLVATGVELCDADGKRTKVVAGKEVIVSAGAFNSPTILMRSGIGDKSEVEKHEISSRVDLPGVGKNLHDHLVIFNFYEVTEPGITNDRHLWHSGGKEKSMAEYAASNTGFFSQFPFGCVAWTRLDEQLKDSPLWQEGQRAAADGRDPLGLTASQPHVEFWNTELYGPTLSYTDVPSDDQHVFGMATTFFSARSRGTVGLKSANPTDLPVVQHNHLRDPLDMLVLSEGCRMANEIILEGEGTKAVVRGSWPAKLGYDAYTKREEWESVIREKADTCYHPAGSCKMGRTDDPMAVVDEKLRVRGVAKLRVADASIMPTLMGGHPQMACYAIGEKLADLLTE